MSIDLAMKGYGPVSAPMEKNETHYPTFHYCGDKELDLPEEGVLEIRFRKTSETSSVDKDGKHHYSCEIEVQKILEVEGEEEVEPPATSGTSKNTEEALDKILKTMQQMVDKDEEAHGKMDKIMDMAEDANEGEDEGEDEGEGNPGY